jgi:aspartate aminotransferase
MHRIAPHEEHSPDVHLNLNVRGMRPSATVAINERSNRLIREGRKVIKFGLGQSPFPVPRPVTDALRHHAHEKDYLPVRGLEALRLAVADYFRRRQGLVSTGEDVIVGPGSKELMFLLQLVYYGDLVVPTPCWVSYAPQATILGRQIRWLPTRREDDWRLTPGQLDDLCRPDPDRPRIVVFNYPNNPTGGTYHLDELRELARVARHYRVILLSDEIYGELHYRGQHVSLGRFYPEGTIVSSGISKWCGAGGWRLGVFVFPPSLRWLLDGMAAVASETYTSTCAPVQYAAVDAFRGGMEIERHLWLSRRILSALGRFCHHRLAEAGALVTKPEGAFYLFPDFSPFREALAARGITDDRTLCERLLTESGVAMLPGQEFGRRPDELTARIATVCFDGVWALAAAEVLPPDTPPDETFLRSFCAPVVEGIDLIREWLHR